MRAALLKLYWEVGAPARVVSEYADDAGASVSKTWIYDLRTATQRVPQQATVEAFLAALKRYHHRSGDPPQQQRASISSERFTMESLRKCFPDECAKLLGAASVGASVSVPSKPTPRGWPGVPLDERVVSGHREHVRAIMPTGGLVGRQRELERLAEFSRSDQQYLCVQAPPYAGKTALLATFAADPPPDTEAVSFFVIGRLAGQSDSATFLDSVLEQLLSLSGDRPPAIDAAAAREGYVLMALKRLAGLRADAGQRLVLVVDGIDEDRSTDGPTRRSSIARLLPRRPFRGLTVIVSRRSDRPLPLDVPDDHPLRTAPVLELTPFERSDEFRREAQQELDALLTGTALQRDLLGLVVAAGGSLTVTDLEELTGGRRYELSRILEGADGRSFDTRPASRLDGRILPEQAYLLAHDTLHREAEEYLGARELERYRDRIHTWATRYADRGWPRETPTYLLHDYPQLLKTTGDGHRLARLALDPARRDRLFETTGGDHAALVEMDLYRALLMTVDEPDVARLMVWSMHREHIAIRNDHIPSGLPLVWFRLGRRQRALSLARSMPNPFSAGPALADIATELVLGGDPDGAEEIVKSLPATEPRHAAPPGLRARAFVRVAAAMAGKGDVAQAEALLRHLPSDVHAESFALLVEQTAEKGHVAVAQMLLRSVPDPVRRLDALVSIAQTAAERSDPLGPHLAQHAFEAARALDGLPERASYLTRIAETMAMHSMSLDAVLGAAEAAAAEEDEEGRDYVLADIVELAAANDDLPRAERITAAIGTPYPRKTAERVLLLTRTMPGQDVPVGLHDGDVDLVIVGTLILDASAREDRGRVRELADVVIANPGSSLLLDDKAMVMAVASTGDIDRALAVAMALSPTRKLPDYRVGLLATAMVHAGEWQRARDLARPRIGKEEFGYSILSELLPAMAQARSLDAAAEFVAEVASPAERAKGFAILACLAFDEADPSAAARYALQAENEGRSLVRPQEHIQSVLRLAEDVAGNGHMASARPLIALIAAQDVGASAVVLSRMLATASPAGLKQASHDIADDLERAVDAVKPHERRQVVENVAGSSAVSTAVRFARADPDPASRLGLLAAICSRSISALPQVAQADIAAAADSAIADVVSEQHDVRPAKDELYNEPLVVRWLPHPWQPFADYATVLIRAAGTEAARDALHAFDSPWQDRARCGLVHGLARAGHIDLALTEMGQIGDTKLHARAMQATAKGLIEAGAIQGAVEIVRDIEDQQICDWARQEVVEGAITAHDLTLATTVAESVEDGSLRAQALTAVALALKETDPAGAALLLGAAQQATTAPSSGWSGRCSPLAGVAEAWSACGGVTQALDIARRLEWSDLMYVAPSIIATGSPEAVVALADIVEDRLKSPSFMDHPTDFRPEVIEVIAQHDGLRSRMETVMTGVARHAFNSLPMEWFAVSAVKRGDPASAIAIANTFSHRSKRAQILLRASEASEAPGPRRRLLAEAISSDLWTTLPVVAEHAPGIVAELADAYLSLWGG
ncbi:hypothetical protein ACFWBR_37830 [Streptomyces sp. NPDC060006]|uniref:hypothetical protein n=1 Tax=unclassified Streptomyces TaxID=2593676 RepID=UPI0036B49249